MTTSGSFSLGNGEKLLWSGQPRQGVILRSSDAFAIPFSLLWGGFAVFWEHGVITSNAPPFFVLWGVPFVLMGLYITVGRFFFDARRRARTKYSVTSERVLIESGGAGRKITSLDLRNLSDLSLETDSAGNGTIYFANRSGIRANSFGPGWPGGTQVPCFELATNARSVYETIRAAQRDAR
jgi:hypothetical protein